MGALMLLVVLGGFLILLPLIALKLLFHLVFGIAVLPFRLASGAVGLVGKLVGLALRIVTGVLGLLVGLAALLFSLVLLPLAPFLLIFGFIWLVASAARPHTVVVRP